jgi:tetratricopeptide (TPR) repeat protein
MLGLLALDDDDEDAAYAAHRRAAEFAERSGEPAAIAIWARNLANLQSRRRRYREAAEWYRKALDAAVRSENVRRVGDCALAWWRSCTAAHRHSDAAEVLLGASRHLRDANRRANFLDRALSSWARAADWARVEVVAPDLLKVFREELRAAPEHVQRVERLLEQARSGGGP